MTRVPSQQERYAKDKASREQSERDHAALKAAVKKGKITVKEE